MNNENIKTILENFIVSNYKKISAGINVYIYSKNFDFSYWKGSIQELSFTYSEDTIYDLASLTKSIVTATLIMKLVEKGKISLFDTLEDIGIYKSNFAVSKITIKELLTHSSGLISWYPLYKYGNSKEDYIRTIALIHERNLPKSVENYSDLNYILLGFVIEEITGKKLDVLAREEIFDLLSMKDTGFNPNIDKYKIAPTEKDPDRGGLIWGKVHDENAYYLGGVSGHAGLFSNVKDIAKFLNAYLKGDLVKKSSLEIMTQPQNINIGGSYGIGWIIKVPTPPNPSPAFNYNQFIGDIAPFGTFGHTGFTGTSVCVYPKNETFIIILTNRVYPNRENLSIIRFRRLFHNLVFTMLLNSE